MFEKNNKLRAENKSTDFAWLREEDGQLLVFVETGIY